MGAAQRAKSIRCRFFMGGNEAIDDSDTTRLLRETLLDASEVRFNVASQQTYMVCISTCNSQQAQVKALLCKAQSETRLIGRAAVFDALT